ncbi:hypothetical protein H5407_18975 [Mitsuaria sp. WAJ17]|nr:hypothetical protein [Mitsuaria sp. WAJ17]MBB2487323.1 hypothetical protein [Mitsuaria sp. WAJ17]
MSALVIKAWRAGTKPIDEQQARSVCTIVQRLIQAKEKRALQAVRT